MSTTTVPALKLTKPGLSPVTPEVDSSDDPVKASLKSVKFNIVTARVKVPSMLVMRTSLLRKSMLKKGEDGRLPIWNSTPGLTTTAVALEHVKLPPPVMLQPTVSLINDACTAIGDSSTPRAR